MSLFYVSVISACTILLPFVASLFRLSRLKDKYLPLIVLLGVGVLSEIISYISIRYKSNNNVNGNIYVLFDFLIVFWLFARFSGTYSKKILGSLMIIGAILWVVDNLVINSLSSNNSLFRMIASVMIVIISVDKVNQLLFTSGTLLTRNTDFLLCLGFLTYYLYKTFVEAFNVFPMPIDRASFHRHLWVILCIINIVTNLLITTAILCVPQKQPFTSHSSQD